MRRIPLLPELLFYPLVGAIAGIMAGLMGVGGGLIIVPALAFYLPHTGAIPAESLMHVAIGTSLATIVPTSVSSSYAHHRRSAVRWTLMASLAPGLMMGALLGAAFADQLRSDTLSSVFAAFLLIVAAHMGLNLRVNPHRELPGRGRLSGAGGLIGFVSAIVGIGGGTMTVPYLSWHNVKLHQAVGTSAACGLPIAIAGAAGFVIFGLGSVVDAAAGYLYWPAFGGIVVGTVLFSPVGAMLAHKLPVAILKRLFAVMLVVVAVRMLV